MNTTEALKAACLNASETADRIDARIRDKLQKRARKHGMTEAEVIELVEAWKRAGKKHPHLGHDRRKGH